MIYAIFYIVGVIICFLFVSKIYETYNKEHPNETLDDRGRQYQESMLFIFSIFSWFSFVILLYSSLFNNGDDYYDDYLEDSDSK